jgi:glycogen phosphorylase
MNNLSAQKLPKRILGLNELAYNLWWSWHPEARHLFKSLDRSLWKSTSHNPVKLLNRIAPHRLTAASEDKEFLEKYDSVINNFNREFLSPAYRTGFPDDRPHLVAYFSMEFALHSSLPIYAGGLGVLAGDYCKEASDLGLPMVCIGFMYPQGYFQQHISEDGWQQERYSQVDFAETPITPVLNTNNQPLRIKVELDSRSVDVAVWQVKIGKTRLYLLDTRLEENSAPDRELTARLYSGNGEFRLQQEIILGMGGVRVLRALQIQPSIWHANEGHTSFMMMERCREQLLNGDSFPDALRKIRQTTVFTTHTPVPAGNDAFPHILIEKYLHNYWKSMGLDRNTFLALGTQPSDGSSFNMTVLGLKTADYRNGVSQLHGAVCRRMWHGLWPELEEKDVPIGSITNGIHVPTWVSPQMSQLYTRYMGPDWTKEHDNQAIWENVKDIPDAEMWKGRQWLKSKLAEAIRDSARQCWIQERGSPSQALAMGALYDPEVLTIGFCRRFTDYKRAWLILKDIERLKRLVCNDNRPVQIVFAGKAHPNDDGGKRLIQQVFNNARDSSFKGRIIYVEDYDLHKARYLVHGVDLWLNTPRPTQEASGTSGMKAALNGVLHLSVYDGWWCEGYNGANGWAIHTGEVSGHDEDQSDAEELYSLLENTIVPIYYDRDRNGIPHGWIRVVKEAIRSCAPSFSARRMLKDYIEQSYIPAVSAEEKNLVSIL